MQDRPVYLAAEKLWRFRGHTLEQNWRPDLSGAAVENRAACRVLNDVAGRKSPPCSQTEEIEPRPRCRDLNPAIEVVLIGRDVKRGGPRANVICADEALAGPGPFPASQDTVLPVNTGFTIDAP